MEPQVYGSREVSEPVKERLKEGLRRKIKMQKQKIDRNGRVYVMPKFKLGPEMIKQKRDNKVKQTALRGDGVLSAKLCNVCVEPVPTTMMDGTLQAVCSKDGIDAQVFICKQHGRVKAEEKYNAALGAHTGCSVCL